MSVAARKKDLTRAIARGRVRQIRKKAIALSLALEKAGCPQACAEIDQAIEFIEQKRKARK